MPSNLILFVLLIFAVLVLVTVGLWFLITRAVRHELRRFHDGTQDFTTLSSK